jgi:uncharacterized protein (TIGR00304 family)
VFLEKKGKLTGTELLYAAGFALILAGIAIIVVVILLLSIRSAGKGKFKGGGAVIIGPVPIIFGSDKKSLKTILLLSIGLTVLLLVVFIVQYLLLR